MTTTRELGRERLRVPEAAERLGVSPSSVYRYVRDGRLRATRDERGLLFTGLAVDLMQGWRAFGPKGPPIWTDEQMAEYLAADALNLPPELQHVLTA